MAWTDPVFRYCERGGDASFWAEPANAISNAAFLIGAVAALAAIARRPGGRAMAAEAVLSVLVFTIGIGSFVFHTFATRWAAQADVIPIGVFMLAYLGYSLRRFLGLHWLWVAVGLVLFVLSLNYAGGIECAPGLLSITAAARGPCLNGTLGYAPALLAMLGIGAALALTRHLAAPYLLAAGTIFLASMVFRTIDFTVCDGLRLWGRARGTHALWHLLNAATLYLLLLAAIRHGAAESRR